MSTELVLRSRNFRHAQYLAAVLDRGMDGAMDVADAEHAALTAEVDRLRNVLRETRFRAVDTHSHEVADPGRPYSVIYPGTAS